MQRRVGRAVVSICMQRRAERAVVGTCMQRRVGLAVVSTCMQRRSHLRVHSGDDAFRLARERLARGEHLAPSGR